MPASDGRTPTLPVRRHLCRRGCAAGHVCLADDAPCSLGHPLARREFPAGACAVAQRALALHGSAHRPAPHRAAQRRAPQGPTRRAPPGGAPQPPLRKVPGATLRARYGCQAAYSHRGGARALLLTHLRARGVVFCEEDLARAGLATSAPCASTLPPAARRCMVPCGHAFYCHACAKSLSSCAICRAPVDSVLKLFI